MANRSAPERRILEAVDPPSREAAWPAFVGAYSPLLLHVARSLGRDHDAVMDRYAFILEQLRRDDFRRLRAYEAKDFTLFTTWLVTVARRICLDHHRHRYGRAPAHASSSASRDQLAARQRLLDLVCDVVDPDELPAPSADPELALRRAELADALGAALEGLPASSRLLIRLRFEDDLTAAEIARFVELPSPFHVYRRINQVLAVLRRQLRAVGVQDPVP